MKAPLFLAICTIALVFAGLGACYDMAKVPACPRDAEWPDPCYGAPAPKPASKKDAAPMVPDADDAGR